MPESQVNKLVSWPRFNIRDVLIATALLAIGLVWPILFPVIVPIIVAGIIARMRFREPVLRALYIVAAVYPFLWLSLVYLMWVNAWHILGRHPSPGNDDPAHISPFVSAVYDIAAVMFLLLPGALLAGFVSLMLTVEPRSTALKSTLVTRVILLVGVYIAFYFWCAADPGQAIEWFFD
ncbi:MAG TPA: hypothetical protein VHK01_15700 [Lacipirellulaceae bacterium]|jgi:hypothetical protein|nr:hypothetical protein [Lacipirellulaceae bacterium]